MTIGDENGCNGLTVNSDIKQFTHVIKAYDKRSYFLDLLRKLIEESPKALKFIVFCMKKRGVDNLENFLNNDRNRYKGNRLMYDVRGIHGDKEQW